MIKQLKVKMNKVPRIEELRVKNYRVLKDLNLKNITPLTVFLGPNGSGKSTILDVFAFLSECFSIGLRKAWDKRGRFKELRTRGSEGAIEIELKYREAKNEPLITYHISINEDEKGPFIEEEWLQWRYHEARKPVRFLDFKNGKGHIITGETPSEEAKKIDEELSSKDILAVNTLGQFVKNPRVSSLRRFITGWYLSYLTADSTRNPAIAGAQERLSVTGDNLPNVIQYLKEQHKERLNNILITLSERIPRLEGVTADIMPDGRLLLQIKDAPFKVPVLAKFASDGTLKMLAYLTVLYDPSPPLLVGIEEPENHLHPILLQELAEECRSAAAKSQLMVTTHSPFFVNGLKAKELFVIFRNEAGFTEAIKANEIPGIIDFMDEGALLGSLWMENHFEAPFKADINKKKKTTKSIK